MKNLPGRQFLLIILALQFAFCVVVLLNIPVARQVVGFVYLTFVPGIIISRLLKIGYSSWSRGILFSAGFSITFLLFAGLLINIVGPTIGFSQPLSLTPLIVMLSPTILLLAILSSFVNVGKHLSISINWKSVLSAALLLCLPALAIVGALFVSFSGNNSILLLLMVAIALCFSVGAVLKKLPSKVYLLIVSTISIALLFHFAFVSNYVTGGDIQVEYYVASLTTSNKLWVSNLPQYWDIVYGRFNSMLSVTILPAIYSSILEMDLTWVLKIVYPIIFSLVPVGLYLMWRPYVGNKRAFFSIFLFMAQLTFYTEMLGLARQMIGEVFFVLLFIVLLSKRMSQFNKNLCFIIFGAALVVSHYSLAYIFMFFIAFAWVASYALRRSSKVIAAMVIIFLVMAFSWYIYTSNAGSFNSLLYFGNIIISDLSEFANLGSRGQGVLMGVGLASSPTIFNTVSRIIAYVIEAFIALGFFSVITKQTDIRFDREYVAFSWVSMGLLAASIIFPGFAATLDVERFFHISLFFLAPFCVIGAEVFVEVLSGFLSKRKFKLRQKLNREMRWKAVVLLVAVLVSYFLFQTSFIYAIVGSQSASIPLSKQRIDPVLLYRSYGYIDESDVFGTGWLIENVDFKHATLFADGASIYDVLSSYGMIYRGDVSVLNNSTMLTANGTVYLSRMNVVDGVTLQGPNLNELEESNSSIYFSILNSTDEVFTNGACEIYVKTG
jgi:uncharacterized membrane protein